MDAPLPVLPQGFQHKFDRMPRLAILGYRVPENALLEPCATPVAALTQSDSDGRSTRLLLHKLRSPNTATHHASQPVERTKAEHCLPETHIERLTLNQGVFPNHAAQESNPLRRR